MKTKYLITFLVVGALAFVEVAVLKNVDIRARGNPGGRVDTQTALVGQEPPPPYTMTPLVWPAKKYLGVTVQGGADMKKITAFANEIGKAPNLVAVFESFNDQFAAAEVRNIYGYGAMAVIRWEPLNVSMRDIAAGKHDAYVTQFAKAVRALNLPIALTFAHEMNGHWYSWGTRHNTAADYVAAWRHVHDIFQQQDAKNVLWTWTPNVINPVPQVKLGPLYPGDAYVDWVGIDGYYTVYGQRTYNSLFGPTLTEIRKLTKKPVLIVETGIEPNGSRPTQIANLMSSVAQSKDVIGVLYFDINGSARWNIDKDPASLRSFANQARNNVFGFDVRSLK